MQVPSSNAVSTLRSFDVNPPSSMALIPAGSFTMGDPFSDNPIVVTGSHNFSHSASAANDENFIVIRGHKKIAMHYAINAMQTTTSTAQRLVERVEEAEYMLRIVASTGVATSLRNRSGGGSHIRLATDVRNTREKEY